MSERKNQPKKDWSVDYTKFDSIVEEDEEQDKQLQEQRKREEERRQQEEMKSKEMEIEDDTIVDMMKKGSLTVAQLYQAVLEMGNPKLIVNVYGKLLRADPPPFTQKEKTKVLEDFVQKTNGIHTIAKVLCYEDKDMVYSALFSIACIESNKQGMRGLLHHRTTLPLLCKCIKEGGQKIQFAAVRALGSCFIEICGIPQITFILKKEVLGSLVPLINPDAAPAVLFSVLNTCVYVIETETLEEVKNQFLEHNIPWLIGNVIRDIQRKEQSQILLVALNAICLMLINKMWGSPELLEVLGGKPFMKTVVKLKKHPIQEVKGFVKQLITMFQDESDRNDLILENTKKRTISGCSARACGKQETIRERFLICGGCKLERYCSVQCQKSHWKAGKHKDICKKRVHVKNQAEITMEKTAPSPEDLTPQQRARLMAEQKQK